MFDKRILTLVGAVGGTNLLITILTAVLATGGISGPTGAPGETGSNGIDGQTPYIGENGNWFIGTSDTGVFAGGGSTPVENTDNIVEGYDLLTNSIQVSDLEALTMDTEWTNRLRQNPTPISTEAELLGMVNGGTYVLTQDIVITNPITPIGYNLESFSVQLDGNNKRISDLTITSDESSTSPVGLFGSLYDSVVFNLIISQATVNKANLSSLGGVLAGEIQNSWIKNVQIGESQVNGIRNTGILTGSVLNSELKDLDLTNNALTAIANLGGLASKGTNVLIENVNVVNLTFESDFAAARTANVNIGDNIADVGGLIGLAEDKIQINNVYIDNLDIDLINGSIVTGVDYNVNYVGGLIGRSNGNQSYIENLQRIHQTTIINAKIMCRYYSGGFIGRIDQASLVITDSKVLFSLIYVGSLNDEFDSIDFENFTRNNYDNLDSYAGGFIGGAHSTGLLFVDTYVNANIIGGDYIGGFVGYSTGNDENHEFIYIKNSKSESYIFTGYYNGGGFGGYWDSLNYVIIENSANLSNINSEYEGTYANSLGGFVGEFYEIYSFILISNSYNTGNVIGAENIGGITGYNEVEGVDNNVIPNGGLLIYNFYNSGDLFGSDNVGGFVGEQYDQDNIMEIYHSFSAGRIYNSDGTDPNILSREYGGFIGDNSSSNSPIRIFNSFYLEQEYDSGESLPIIGFDASASLNSTNDLPISGFITMYLSGSQGGSSYTVANLDAFTNQANFYFSDIWNFEEVWTFELTNDGLPTLIHTFQLPA